MLGARREAARDTGISMVREGLNENDLADLIEGRLSAERSAAIREMLRGDPALVRALEGMLRDRKLLKGEGKRSVRLPAGFVEEVIARAEREALLGAPAGEARGRSTARGRRHRVLGVLALAGGASALLVGILLAVVQRNSIERSRARSAEVAAALELDRPDSTPLAPGSPGSPGSPGALGAPAPSGAGGASMLMDPGEIKYARTDTIRPDGSTIYDADPFVPPSEVTDPSVRAWTRDVEQKLEAEARATVAVDVGWVTDEMVMLAVEGRLKLVVPDDVGLSNVRAEGADPQPGFAGDAPAVSSEVGEPASKHVVLRYRTDDGLSGVRRAIAEYVCGLGVTTPARLSAARAEETLGGPGPATDAEQVLWWLAPASTWARYSNVWIAVETLRTAHTGRQ